MIEEAQWPELDSLFGPASDQVTPILVSLVRIRVQDTRTAA
jgi:hypothetical protein